MHIVHVAGVGMGRMHITPELRELAESTRTLAGGRRLLEFFPEHSGARLLLDGDISGWLERVAEAAENGPVLVLASGDPGFFGVAAKVMERFAPEQVIIHPNVTAMQAALARLKRPWSEVATVSLHGRDWKRFRAALSTHPLVAAYTDPVHTPTAIARLLLERDLDQWKMHVMENLGQDSERCGTYSLHQAEKADFSALNVVVMERLAEPPARSIGRPEEEYEHEAGLITKTEIRSVALGKLDLQPDHVLWDLGAGCGSVGIEASFVLTRGMVAAVEKRPERAAMISANRRRFCAANLEIVSGDTLDVLDVLPDPDRVFVGGGGADLTEIVTRSAARLPQGGVLVAAVVQLASLASAHQAMADAGLDCKTVQVQVSRAEPLGTDQYFKAQNPVWLLAGRKGVS